MASCPQRLPQAMQGAFAAFIQYASNEGKSMSIKRSRQERLSEATTELINFARATPGAAILFPVGFFDGLALYGTAVLRYIIDITPIVFAAKYLIGCLNSDDQYQEFSEQMARLFAIDLVRGADPSSPQAVLRNTILSALAQPALTSGPVAISENTHPPLRAASTATTALAFRTTPSPGSASSSSSASAHTAGPYDHPSYLRIQNPCPTASRPGPGVVPRLPLALYDIGSGAAPLSPRIYTPVPDTMTRR